MLTNGGGMVLTAVRMIDKSGGDGDFAELLFVRGATVTNSFRHGSGREKVGAITHRSQRTLRQDKRLNEMNGILTRTELKQPGRLTRLTLLASLALILAAVVLVFVIQARTTPVSQDSIQAAIEDRYGIHITMLAVTAGGGAVDFRFQITDPEKANNYMHGPFSELPFLIVEKSGTRIDPRPHTHHVDYEFGRSYYTLYRNPGGVIEAGTRVTAVLGDLRLRNIVIR